MTYVPTIPDWFMTRKAAQVTAFFALKAGGAINILKATKLIYLADRLSMERKDFPVVGDVYVSMPFGPVNSYTYSHMQGVAANRQDEWLEFISPRYGNTLRLAQTLSPDELDELSRGDVKVLEDTWEKFKDIDQFDLAQWTHDFCPEWKNPNGSSIPIELATIFDALDKDDPVDRANELQAERALISSYRAA
ncbi:MULTISPECIES: Panacea domain-containing protein [Agrobacterium]|uniref:Panacea domain-containing protein n=1 Tax=Agrobacterium TaxID=357 RepID=UPI00069C0B99|nr:MULTISPECIES: Panacea domain-containing protein [Agrobacterium]KNY33205.1 hypothetical protein AKG12_15640 [Agrobacterium sp. SUL3]MCD4663323.1 SocA family protein [Agrobacterium sp.]QXC50890.1 SocA family protein [Agrobacterium salinitolerans]